MPEVTVWFQRYADKRNYIINIIELLLNQLSQLTYIDSGTRTSKNGE